jgi:hypothetical protein
LLGSTVCGYVPQGLTTLPCTVMSTFSVSAFFSFVLLPFIVLFFCLFPCVFVPNKLRLTLGLHVDYVVIERIDFSLIAGPDVLLCVWLFMNPDWTC